MAEQIMNRATDWVPPHPGEYIKDELAAREWSQRDLAFILGCPEQSVTLILNGKRGVSAEMAKALSNAFDVSPDVFSNLQRAYDLAHATDPSPDVAKRALIQDKYLVREMLNRGWLEPDENASGLEVQLAKFFGVSDISHAPHFAYAAKRTPSHYDEFPKEQLVWLFRVRQIASHLPEIAPYSEKKFRETIRECERLLLNSEGVRLVTRLLGECGVRLIIVEHLPGSKIDGVCFWLGDSPVIGMSLRLDRIDNFWFVFRHEVEHVLNKHGREKEVIDVELESSPQSSADDEKIANDAAANFCVPKAEMDNFVRRKDPYFGEAAVLGFAKTMQRHPGLVVGQLHHRTKRYQLLKRYQVKIRHLAVRGAIVDGWGQVFPTTD